MFRAPREYVRERRSVRPLHTEFTCASRRVHMRRLQSRAMKRMARIVSTLLVSVALVACGSREASNATTSTQTRGASNKPLTIKGSDTMVILGQRLAEEYMKKN